MLRRIATLCTLGALAMACGSDFAIAPGPSLDDLPNLTGTWRIEAALAPIGFEAGGGGSCALSPMVIALQKGPGPSLGVAYRGTHSAGTLTCTGITAAATQSSGMRDTVITLPADSVSGWIAYEICGATFPIESPPCSTPLKTYVYLMFTGLLMSAENATATGMHGGMNWYDANDVARLFGTWTASKHPALPPG